MSFKSFLGHALLKGLVLLGWLNKGKEMNVTHYCIKGEFNS